MDFIIIKPVLYSLVIILTLSCKQKYTEIPVIHLSKTPDKDGIIRDIPPYHVTSGFEKSRHHKYEEDLGLLTLKNGFDKLQIRIWQWKGLSDTARLYIVKNTNDTWTAELYYLRELYDKDYNKLLDSVTWKKADLKIPNSGWQEFTDQLFKLDILTLPDYRYFPDYGSYMDEDAVLVEIGEKNIYRMYVYLTPQLRVKEFKQAKKILAAFDLMEREFNLRRYFSESQPYYR